MIGGELFHRRPCLALMTNVLPFVAADRTRVVFRYRKAGRTQLHAIFHRQDRLRERLRFVARTVQQIEHEPRRGLRTDRRKFAEFVDQSLDRTGDAAR